MVKKFLLSAAVIGALSTSAMAYNVSQIGDMNVSANNIDANNSASVLTFVGFNQTQTSNALIFPAYFVGNGWQSTIRVINTDSKPIVAKVVFYDGKDSHEVKDFNIYLSGNDVWTGTVKVDSDGVAKIISTDDSTPLENGGLASAAKPFAAPISSSNGYIEVIGMASVTTVPNGYEHNHAILRDAYNDFAKRARNPKADGSTVDNLIFRDGVVQNQKVTLPFVDLNSTINTGNARDNGTRLTYTFGHPQNVLTGDIRITDTVNGKDMDLPAYKVNYNANGSKVDDALVYLEGEKANLADVLIGRGNKTYNSTSVQTAIDNMSYQTAYITYGDAPVNDMYAILTDPFKRVYVQSYLSGTKSTSMPNTAKYYKDANTDADGNINYGSTSLIAQIYDESENVMTAGQFSPATTPTIKLTNEVATTGYDVNDANTLAYYLNQAEAKGYKKGFVKLTNSNGNDIPGIMTQMLATKAGDRVVTNWIVPQEK